MNPNLNSQKQQKTLSMKDILAQRQQVVVNNPYITQEFQDYGYQLAERLGDLKYKSLYIKLAKTHPRALLERAYSFVVDYPNATNKGKIFMWKLKQLKETMQTQVKPEA